MHKTVDLLPRVVRGHIVAVLSCTRRPGHLLLRRPYFRQLASLTQRSGPFCTTVRLKRDGALESMRKDHGQSRATNAVCPNKRHNRHLRPEQSVQNIRSESDSNVKMLMSVDRFSEGFDGGGRFASVVLAQPPATAVITRKD